MSELRRDALTERWVIIAEGRSARPDEYSGRPPSRASTECPFCEGNESRTPPEVAADRSPDTAPNGPGWTVRTIPNRFPTLAPTPGLPDPLPSDALFLSEPGSGVHEVIIESPHHEPAFPFLPVDQVKGIVRMFRKRMSAVAAQPGMRSVLLFENHGPESGGTLV
ncbi:MAG: galactose-1-phosphate uridylyltransferase, partial [Thermoplasmata archaeon]